MQMDLSTILLGAPTHQLQLFLGLEECHVCIFAIKSSSLCNLFNWKQWLWLIRLLWCMADHGDAD